MYLDYCLLGLTFSVCLIAAITDIKNGKIYNKLLVSAFFTGIIFVIPYYIFNRELLNVFIFNLISAVLVALSFYMLKIWGAGDAKLWMLINVLFPAGVYFRGDFELFPGFRIFTISFLLAFIYVLIETTVLYYVKREQPPIITAKSKIPIRIRIINCLIGYCIISEYYLILQILLGNYFYENKLFWAFGGFIILIFIQNYWDRYNLKYILAAISFVTYMVEYYLYMPRFEIIQLFVTGIIVAISLLLKKYASSFNYEWLETAKVKSGMIFSYSSVLQFHNSKVKELPLYTDETTRSRITEGEAAAVRRWEKSKCGKDKILIVRHLPFAVFFLLGTAVYVLLFRR